MLSTPRDSTLVHQIPHAVPEDNRTLHHQGGVCGREEGRGSGVESRQGEMVNQGIHCTTLLLCRLLQSLMDDVNVLNLLQPAARGVGPAPNPVGEGDTVGDFHLEMVQLCLDVLARYTYSLVSTQPNRCVCVCVCMCACVRACVCACVCV